MPRILIIADDLSGAADCGIAFAAKGLSTVVALGEGSASANSDVFSIDADTRALNAQQSEDKTERLMRQFGVSADQIVFKKLDSTLRGNVGAELAAVLRVRRSVVPRAVAVFAPAFPANGRTTVAGKQLLNRKPLEETDIWRREGKQGNSYIPGILENAHLRPELLSLKTVRSANGGLREAMNHLSQEADVIVCDAETDHDLRAIAQASSALGKDVVWAGSAGLAHHLPTVLGLEGTSSVTSNQALTSGPTLFVVGSPSPTSCEQARLLASSSGITAVTIQADAAPESYERQINEAFSSGRDVVVSLAPKQGDGSDARHLCLTLAKLLAPYADSIGALVATGGETARAVLGAFGVNALRLVQELENGVPFSITENWCRRLPVITKAGDFGSPQTLLRCRDFFTALDRHSSHHELKEP